MIDLDTSISTPRYNDKMKATNAKGDGYNPYRDSKGRFDDGLTLVDIKPMKKKEKYLDYTNAQKDSKEMDAIAFKKKYLPSRNDPQLFKDFIIDKLIGEPSKEEDAIEEALSYQATSFLTVNKYLATNPDESKWNSTFKRITNSLDKAFTWTADDDFTVFRKIDQDYYKLNEVGQRFTELNYGSTSLNPDEATAGAWGEGPILVIDVPKGQKVSILDMYSGDEDDLSIYGQQEVLLPRGTKYEVVEIINAPDGYTKLVRVKIV